MLETLLSSSSQQAFQFTAYQAPGIDLDKIFSFRRSLWCGTKCGCGILATPPISIKVDGVLLQLHQTYARVGCDHAVLSAAKRGTFQPWHV